MQGMPHHESLEVWFATVDLMAQTALTVQWLQVALLRPLMQVIQLLLIAQLQLRKLTILMLQRVARLQ